MQVAIDSGLPGLSLVVIACCGVTLATAQTIDSDEAMQIVMVSFFGTMVGAYRVWNTNKRSNGN